MSPHMIRYTVKPDHVAHHEELLHDIFDELGRAHPASLSYEAFKLPDGLSFIHLIGHEKGGHGALPTMTAFRAFHVGLRERCQQAPVRTELDPLGAYRLFDP